MATSPLFGWQEPDDTSLVKDGAAAIRTLGNAIDSSMGDLLGGTTGQVLAKASNTNMDFTWVAQDDSNAIQNAIVDAKGDLIAATANDTPARLAVGNNGETLVADSSTATGLKWAPRGKVNQIVQGTYGSQTAVTSTSYVTTLLTATITPTSTSSKILINAVMPFYGNNGEVRFTIFRGTVAGTDLSPYGALAQDYGLEVKTIGLTFLDSPATTSPQTYTIGVKVTAGTAYMSNNPSTSVITLTEVLA